MSFYANPSVTVHAHLYCQNCTWADAVVVDDGDRVVSDHRCPGYYEEDTYDEY